MDSKRCTRCGETLLIDAFSLRSDNGRPMSACRRCNAERVRKARGEQVNVHQSKTVNGEHSPELAEIIARLEMLQNTVDELRTQNAELRQIVEAQQENAPQRQTADVNISAPQEPDAREQHLMRNLLKINFATDKLRGI